MLSRTAIGLIFALLLVGCEPAVTATPVPLQAAQIQPTATFVQIKSTPTPVSATATPTPARTPTRTPTPTTAPYIKMPEQTDDGWQTGSLVGAGIDPVRINKMLEHIYKGREYGDTLTLPNGTRKMENIHGILIVKNGKLVFEEYFYHYSRDSSHDLASVTKSITSLLVGSAIDQGYLEGVDEKILPYFPEYLPLKQPDERKESITVEDLLTMRHGLECDDWDPASRTYYKKEYSSGDPYEIESVLNYPMVTLPGSHFSYCTSGTVLLNALLTKASGTELSLFADQSLLGPLGIKSVPWDSSFKSMVDIGGILLMRPRDMAKIGQLVLQSGEWNGKQVISEDWLRLSTQEHVPLPFNETWGNGYGYLWWLSDVRISGTPVHSIAASGHGGQVITIFPDLNMVVVITGGNYDHDEGQPFQIMEKFILPAVLSH